MFWYLWILIALIAVIIIMFITYYNKFVLLGNRIDNSLSQIDVQLKRRADLIPNLIETVKGYAKHEKGIMTEVTNARKALMSAKDMPAKLKADEVKTPNSLLDRISFNLGYFVGQRTSITCVCTSDGPANLFTGKALYQK